MPEAISPEDLAELIADALHQVRLIPDDDDKFRHAVEVITEEIYARLAIGEYVPPLRMHGKPSAITFTRTSRG